MYGLPLLLFNHEFKLQDPICNSFHDLAMLCLNLSNAVITTVIKNVDCCCIFDDIIKSDVI